MTSSITFGSDPELPIFDASKKLFVSALNVLKVQKNEPIQLKDGVSIFADNALLEMNIPPADSPRGVMGALKNAILQVGEYLHGINPSYTLIPRAAVEFPASELIQKEAWTVGCNPNISAYTLEQNKGAKFTNGIRTGSFHIHIGHPNMEEIEQKQEFIKLMDLFVGCGSTVFDPDPTLPERRKLYGRAGEFRPTPYGVEYRVMGNWCLNSPYTTWLAIQLTNHAIEAYDAGVARDLLIEVDENDIISAINECDRGLAELIIHQTGCLDGKMIRRLRNVTPAKDIKSSWTGFSESILNLT